MPPTSPILSLPTFSLTRAQAITPIPGHAFGNCWRPAFAILSQTEDSYDLITKLRHAITEINDGYIKKLQYEDYLSSLSKWIDFFKKDIHVCNFTSWCRFPMYKVCTMTLLFKNMVILMSSSSRDGIEAWVNFFFFFSNDKLVMNFIIANISVTNQ
ncbi:Vinorine synthase [Handroanthus impetiginosus]|uniref:Vinorine synthase n=1 Tax=Handroanthus impetiginosus TaxID=429701 RepID=A0A2G9GDF5_9LAMI|nr:Vinorine synthase [Handroanthus impetiginosus]